MTEDERFAAWLSAVERRAFAELTFPEVRKGLQAISAIYTARRDKLGSGAVFDGRGKRAAFALFYGPLHFLVVRHVLRELGDAALAPAPREIVDLGCGTAVAGAAWSIATGGTATISGVERNDWAQSEAKRTLADLGLRGRIVPGDLAKATLPGNDAALVAAWAINELPDATRAALLPRILAAGARTLILEPIAKSPVPWWTEWADAFEARGGRADEWKWRESLPDPLNKLDRAAHLDHRTLSARTLFLPCH